jgi:hypothetical protein
MTKIISAFCGVGKTFTSDKKINCLEFECWKYDLEKFPSNYIEDIKSSIDKSDYIFISTNPIVLKELFKGGIEVTLVYPSIELKSEYMDRYKNRGSEESFIKLLDDNWEIWINELKEQNYCKRIELKSGEYLLNYMNI